MFFFRKMCPRHIPCAPQLPSGGRNYQVVAATTKWWHQTSSWEKHHRSRYNFPDVPSGYLTVRHGIDGP